MKHRIIAIIIEIGISTKSVIVSKIVTKEGKMSRKYLRQNRCKIGNTNNNANIFFVFVLNISLLLKVTSATLLKIIDIVDITNKNLNMLTINTKICIMISGFVYCNIFSNLVNVRIIYSATTINRLIV